MAQWITQIHLRPIVRFMSNDKFAPTMGPNRQQCFFLPSNRKKKTNTICAHTTLLSFEHSNKIMVKIEITEIGLVVLAPYLSNAYNKRGLADSRLSVGALVSHIWWHLIKCLGSGCHSKETAYLIFIINEFSSAAYSGHIRMNGESERETLCIYSQYSASF